jgi:hypothetical protein
VRAAQIPLPGSPDAGPFGDIHEGTRVCRKIEVKVTFWRLVGSSPQPIKESLGHWSVLLWWRSYKRGDESFLDPSPRFPVVGVKSTTVGEASRRLSPSAAEVHRPNSNHVGRILDKCRISGWRMLLLQGGFVISVSFKLFKNFNENL